VSLPAGIQVTPNMFFIRNDQGQVMLMTGQPQAVPGAGGDVRLQQSAGTAVFRVCNMCVELDTCFFTFLNHNQMCRFVLCFFA